MHHICSAGSDPPSPSMFSKCFHNITVTTNRIRIYARLPLFSDKYSRTVCIDLRIRVRIDINGQPKAMFTFHTVASPVISTDTLNRELLRSIIDFCKNLFYVVCNRTSNLYMGGPATSGYSSISRPGISTLTISMDAVISLDLLRSVQPVLLLLSPDLYYERPE